MSKLELNTKTLLKFLNLCSINSSDKEVGVTELLAEITPDKIQALGKNTSTSIAYQGNMLGTFPELGQIGIDNLTILKNFINGLTADTCTMKKTENKLTTEIGNVKFSAALRNPKFITSCPDKEKYEKRRNDSLGNEFKIKSEDTKKILSYFKTIGANTFTFSGKDNSVEVHMSNQENEVTITLAVDKPVTEFKSVRVGKLLYDVLLNLVEYDLTVSIKDSNAIYLKIADKEINFEYIVAPLVTKK